MAKKAVIDFDEVMDRMAGDWELLGEMCDIFFEQAPVNLALVRRGLARKDTAEAAKGVHLLISLAGNLGGNQAMATARKLEAVFKGRSGEDPQKLFKVLETQFGELTRALRELLARAPGA